MKRSYFILIGLIAMLMILSSCRLPVTGEAKKIPTVKMECGDGKDNDGDGFCDFLTAKTKCRDGSEPGDPDCMSLADNNEAPECIPSPEICDEKDNDCDGLVDNGLAIECALPGDCGVTDWSGEPYCDDYGNIWRDWTSYKCSLPGTCLSACSSVTQKLFIQYCPGGCLNGGCLPYNNQTNSS